jgi:T5SS/PEP-CTERM-associated repeat protein
VDFGQHHVGDLLSQTLSVGNIATVGASTEALDANIGGTSGAATASGSFTLLPAGGIDTSHLKVGLATSQDGAQSGSVILALNSDGTGIDTFGVTPLTSQTITVEGTLYNYATATTVAPVSFGERHVGDTLSQALTITNSGAIDGFTETLDAGVGGTTGAATASGSFNRLGVAVTDSTSLKVGLTAALDGVQTGTAVLSLNSDGSGIDTLGTTALTSQTISATGTLFNYATASVATPVSLGKHHVGDTVAQSLTIINSGTADGFTEALDGSIGGTTGAATATGSFSGLGASHTDGTSVTIGLLSTQDGAHAGTAKLSLTSDGSGIDSLGSSPLTAQTITATGTFYNFATASVVAPNPVNFGTHHVGDTLAQSLSIINSGTADGFTENLDGSIGGTTGAATASGSFSGLGAAKSDSASLTIGLLSTQDGAHAGTATLTLNSDGGTIDGLGTTTLAAQTIAATGTFYNYATASAVSGNFGNHHVGDTLSEVLSITNAGTADGFTEALNASIGGATGGATASGSFSGLAASKTDTSHLAIGLSSAGDGLHSGTAVLTAISDGTGIDSLGTTALTAQTIAVTGTLYNYATASVLAPSTVNFGVHHVGDSLQQGIAIGNLGTFDGFTEALDVGFGGTIGAAYGGIGSAVTSTPFTLTAGNYRAIAIGLTTAHDGVQSGTVTVTAASDGTGIDNLGTTALASQTIAATGTLYNYATASTAGTVDLGNHHVGDTISQALTITDTGTADGFTERLDGSIGNATGAVTVKGSFSGLAASKSDTSSLITTLAATSEGRQSGAAVVTFASDGSGIDGLGNKTLQLQTIIAAGTIFGYATPILSATTLDFGASRLGGVVPTRSLTIRDGSTANPFQENLGYAFHAPSGGFGLTSSAVGTIVAGAAGATVSWSVLTSVSGVLATSTDLVDLTSLGVGTSGLANTALTSQRIALLAKVYAPAVAQLSASSVNFGVVHVGDVISGGDTITNTVTGGLTDVLTGGIGTITGSAFSGTTTLGTGLVAGASKRLSFGLNTGTAGVFDGAAALVLASHDADQADLAVTAAPITLSGTVDNYATAAIEELSGGGSFSHSGSLYTLNLGTVGIGAASPTAALGVLNAATGLADLLSGSFAVGGSGFINNGLTAFSGVGAGNADTTPTIALSTTQIGTFTEAVTLLANGSNSSGYVGALPAEILTVTGTVVAGPRALVWTGAGSTDFADPFNWNDTTSALDPAISAPKVADTATFSGDGGVITGTGSAASLSFGGGGAWHLGSGAALTTPGGVTVGTTEAAQLLINGAAGLVGTGSAGASIAAQPGASGSSVNVTGAGSDWQIAGALDVGNAATGLLAITNGATVTAATLDAGGEASGAGIVTVSGPNADLVTTGTVTIGDAGSGELSILNGANATIGGDLNVANAGTGTGNVDIEDTTGTITFGGNILVGFNGFGVFNVGFGVDYIQNNGGIIFGPDSSGAINSFADPSPFLSNSSPSPISIGAQGVDQLAAYLFNSGEFTIPTNHSLTFDTPIISGGGSFALGSGDSLVLNADTVTGQTFTLGSNDKLTIGIDQLATIDLPASGTGPFTPESNPNKGDLLLGNFSGVIANFTSGDTIDVDTYLSSASAGTLSQNGSVVSVIEIANGATLGVLRFDTAANATAAIADGAIALVPCFAAGTRISTDRGEVAVEAIEVGNRVRVLLGGGFSEVIWVGRREVDCACHAQPRKVWPVRIAAGAFGPGRPHGDVWLSPDHAVFVNDVLIPIRHLINGSTIAQVKMDRITYHHIELAEHDVLLAEGLPAESFLDMRDGSNYANRPGPTRLYPDYSARIWEAFGCARLVVTGPELAVARALVTGFAAGQQAA